MAREKNDQKAFLAAMLDLAELLNYSAPSAKRLALAYAELGDQEHAIQSLRDFVTMGESDDTLVIASQFSSLKSVPQFAQLLKQMELNKSPIKRAVTIAEFRDPGLLPEDIDYDEQSKSFLVTSVLEKKIIRIGTDGSQTDFTMSPDGWPMLAIKINSKTGLVWATEVALNEFTRVPSKDSGRSAVLCFRLEDGHLIRRIEGPTHSAFGDMALTLDGDVIVADNDGGGVYQVVRRSGKADALKRLDAGDFISPQTPAVHPDGRHVLVPDYARGVGVLDMATQQVHWIETSRQHTLQGIDGLYFRGHTMIAVQNGSSPERVVAFHLDAKSERVVSEEIIEQATPTLGDPTHGVIVGDSFFYLANSGWDALDEAGKLKPHSKLTVAHVMKAPIKGDL
ncbi:MAG TPA: hypothetical protein VNB49_13255 [Candidatus Dormibacteraeota bacterium]|nr:hypothetical protein [Candidatus Dormibacteraeota bacterium]